MLNQALVNTEREVDRVQIDSGGATTHPYLGSFPMMGCFPLPVRLTGTLAWDANGVKVLGTSTVFLTELAVGDYIYFNGQIRKIKYIFSDTMLQLEYAFEGSAVTAAILESPPTKHYKMITAKSTGTADALLNEQSFAIGQSIVAGGTPLSYNVTTSNAAIEFTASR